MSSSEINSTNINININPPSSSKLFPAPAPVVNAWGTRTLLSTPSNPVAAAAAATTFPAQPVAAKNNDPNNKTTNTKSNETNTNGTPKFQKKAKEEQWPSAQEAVSEKQTSNNHAQPVSTLKELKKGPNNREKWVPYDATIVISSSTGTNKKNGVTGEKQNGNGATSNGFNNKPSQSKSKSKKSKQNKNKEIKDLNSGNGKQPREPRGRKWSEPTKRSNGSSKHNNYGNDQKRQGNSLSKQGNPDNNSKLEKITITSATCIESNASDASATLDSGASETTHATTEDGDITLSKNLEANNTLPSDSTTDLRPKLKSHPNQPQHHQVQQHFAPQLLSQQPPQFFQQGIPNGQFVQQQYLPPPQFQQSQQFIINSNKNSKHRNSEPFHGNSRSISGGSSNSRRYSNNNNATGNRKHFNNANNYRHSVSGTTFNHGPDVPFAFPQVNYGHLPIMNQQNISYAYGQPAVGHILPQPRSRSSSQAAVKENFVITPFQGQPPQQPFLSTQQFNGVPYDGPHIYQPFMEDPVSTIANQLNYYFSVDNLVRDTHLRKQMNSLGFLPVAKIMEFRRVQNLTQGNLQLLCDAIATLPQLELRGTKVRLKEGYSKWIFPLHQRDVVGKVEEPETQQVSEKTPSETVTQS